MNKKRIIYTTLLIIWMLVIFLFSNQNGISSQSTSDNFMSNVITVVTEVTNQEILEEEKINIISNTSFIIRKLAHFTIYFILGVLAYLTFDSYSIKKSFYYSIVFCIMYAISDEVHQLFSEGRSFKILDIAIDTCGSLLGIRLISLKDKIIKKYNINSKKLQHINTKGI